MSEDFWSLTWRRFSERGKTANAFAHWESGDWPADRRYLTILAETPALEPLAVEVAAAAGLRPVLADGLHLTIDELGVEDVVREELIFAVRKKLNERAQSADPMTVHIEGVCSFPDALIGQVASWDRPKALRRGLRAAIPELRSDSGDPDLPAADFGMAPHISLAYYPAELPAAPIVEATRRFRSIEPIALQVEELVLASVHKPTGPYFTWDVVERFPL